MKATENGIGASNTATCTVGATVGDGPSVVGALAADAARHAGLDDDRRLRQGADSDVENHAGGDVEVVGVELLGVLDGGERQRRHGHRPVAVGTRLRPEPRQVDVGTAVEVGAVNIDARRLGGRRGVELLALGRFGGVGEGVPEIGGGHPAAVLGGPRCNLAVRFVTRFGVDGGQRLGRGSHVREVDLGEGRGDRREWLDPGGNGLGDLGRRRCRGAGASLWDRHQERLDSVDLSGDEPGGEGLDGIERRGDLGTAGRRVTASPAVRSWRPRPNQLSWR